MFSSKLKFTRKIFLFSLPLIAYYLVVYLYASYYPSIFKKKADFMDAHKGEIEVLFLGSSHAQYGINVRLLDPKLKAMNLAYGGQTIMLNKMLFEKFAPEMPNLKYLIIELDYFSLEHFTGNEEYRQPLYQKFYDIAPGSDAVWSRYFFSIDDLKFFSHSILQTTFNYVKNADYDVNEWGFIENNVNYEFAQLNYDEAKIDETALARLGGSHYRPSLRSYKINTLLMDSMLEYCEKYNIKPIFVGYPVYDSYYKRELKNKQQRRMQYIAESMEKYPAIEFWNFEQDTRFTVKDYWDDHHLDANGGNKLSTIINEKLRQIAR